MAQALEAYRRLLVSQPQHPDLLRWLGLAECQSGQLEEGLHHLDQSLALVPGQPEALFNRALALKGLGRLEASAASYEAVLKLKPDHADAWYNLGNVQYLRRQSAAALAAYDRAITLQPGRVGAHLNRAMLLGELHRLPEALEGYARVIALDPRHHEAHFNRGVILQDLRRLHEALDHYDRAIACQPDFIPALNNRALVLQQLRRFDEAVAAYDRVAERSPSHDWLLGHRLHARMMLSDWAQLDALTQALVQGVAQGRRVAMPFPVLSLIDSPQLQLRSARLYAQTLQPQAVASHAPRRRDPGQKIRVAYVSSDFGDHPVTHLLIDLLERHDRDRFEVFAYSLGPQRQDAWMSRVHKAVDQFLDLSTQTDAMVARLAQQHRIDIAVDLNGYTGNGHPGLFAARMAPIQVSYLGYLGTLGSASMDYLMADAWMVPEAQRRFYDEKIVYLPSYQCHHEGLVHTRCQPTRSDMGLPEGAMVYASFNNNYKITPETFALWMNILQRVPGSVLWLYAGHPQAQRNLMAQAVRSGVSPERVILAQRVDADLHQARQGLADLFLDTHPYNAGATAGSALRAGLPVLTRAGDSLASRMGAGLLDAAGLPELITESAQAYVDRAVELGTRPQELRALRRRLSEGLQRSALFDSARFVLGIESAYEQMVARHAQGLPPDHLHIA